MDTKDPRALFNDDLVNLFDESDMEFEEFVHTEETMLKLISLLKDETTVEKKLESIENLTFKFVPLISLEDVEEKILQYLMPAVKNLLNDVFSEIYQTLSAAEMQGKSAEVSCVLQEYLQMCLKIHETLNYILQYTMQREAVDLCYVPSVPLNVVDMLLLTFQHCKESDKLYKIYFHDLKEILQLFKISQDVHIKLLQLMNSHVNFNFLVEEEYVLLRNVLETLGKIGEVLVDMNVKALADNWKGYMALSQKHADVLNQYVFDVSVPLGFLASEIAKNLENILKVNTTDQKGYSQTLKLCNFFVKVILKLCETFWPNMERICGSLIGFLSLIYRYYPPFLKFKGHCENIISQMDSLVFACTNLLLDKLLHEPEFYKALNTMNIRDTHPQGFMLLMLNLSQKLAVIANADAQLLNKCKVHVLIEIFFAVISESYCELFWQIEIPRLNEKQSLYDATCLSITHIILSLQQEQYNKVELILFKNVLHNRIWSAMLAMDVWCLVLRHKDAQLTYSTLKSIIAKIEPVLHNILTTRPEVVFLETLLQRLYALLPENYKLSLIEKYSPSSNLHIWRSLGFRNIPRTHTYVVESVLINIMDKIEVYRSGKCNVNDFCFLCDSFEAVASLPQENGINLQYLVSALIKMWDFEAVRTMQNSVLLNKIIHKLCLATNNLILLFTDEQLLFVLTKLRQLIAMDLDVKIPASQILNSLSTKCCTQSHDKNQIIVTVAEMFRSLLKDPNPIIKQNMLEIFVNFLNVTPHEEIVQTTVTNEKELQRIVSNFMQKNIQTTTSVKVYEYFAVQEKYEFQHTCPVLPEGQKRDRTDSEEVNCVVKRIKYDVALFHKLCGKENLAERNLSEILDILTRDTELKF